MFCKHCGHEVEGDGNFCLNCGKSLGGESNGTAENEKYSPYIADASTVAKKKRFFFSKSELKDFLKTSKTDYCTNCGTNVGKSKFCPNCHLKTNNGINGYCAYCGSTVENGKCSKSNVAVEISLLEKLLRFVSIFLICFSFLGVLVQIFDRSFLAAIIMGGISLLCSIFIISKRQIYKLKALFSAKNIKQVWIFLVYILVIALILLGIRMPVILSGGLSGDDLEAYNLISEASYEFKNPSSVRIVSGDVFYDEEEDEWCGWFALSATNGYGARSVGYYFVAYLDGEIFALDLEEHGTDADIRHAKTRDVLDCDKINNALDKKWGTSN